MLHILREKAQGVMAWIIILAIAISFTLFSMSGYFSFGNGSIAAKVNGEKISKRALDIAYEQFKRQYGTQADEDAVKNYLLGRLIERTALLTSVNKLGFKVSDEQVATSLVKIPLFQVDGQFSKDQYLNMLHQAAYTDADFRKELSQNLLLTQLEQGLQVSNFLMPNEINAAVELLDQKRDFSYALISEKKLEKKIALTSEQIQNYYNEHKSEFIRPEQVTLEYVELSIDQLTDKIKPTNDEAKAYYEEHLATYTTPERVHAKHILIKAPKNDPIVDQEAKDKCEALLKQLKNGADFSKLAKENSDDPGSAEKGGDLSWFVQGQMVPEFEKVAFNLKKNSISEPVRTEYGYHIIQVIDHKKSEVRPFNTVQNLVVEQLKAEKAQSQFAENAEHFAKIAFEQASSLNPIAEQLNLKVLETEPFGREGGKGVASNPEVIKLAFTEDFIKQRRNSEPLKISENSTVVVRVKNHSPAVQLSLVDAKKQVEESLISQLAKTKAQESGESFIKELQSGKAPAQLAKLHQLDWITKSNIARTNTTIDQNIMVAAFQVPSPISDKPIVQGLTLPNGDYLIVSLNKVTKGNPSNVNKDTLGNYLQSLAELSLQLEFGSYASQVLNSAKVTHLKTLD